MSGYPKLDLGIAATSTVLTADQLMRALEAGHEGKQPHAKKHLAYAGIGAAVAVGAIELLRRDEQARKEEERDRDLDDGDRDLEVVEVDRDEHHHHHHHDEHEHEHEYDEYYRHGSRSRSGSHSSGERGLVLAAAAHDRERRDHENDGEKHREPHGHKRRIAEEIAGVYALGEEIMGNKKHHVAHIVAEALAAVAAFKDRMGTMRMMNMITIMSGIFLRLHRGSLLYFKSNFHVYQETIMGVNICSQTSSFRAIRMDLC